MHIVYIAGPFRGANSWETEQNIRRAEALALKAWRCGVAVICPHTNTRFVSGAADDELWLRGDLEILLRCDAILLTSNWRRSAGAITKHELAVKCGIPVFESLNHLIVWSG